MKAYLIIGAALLLVAALWLAGCANPLHPESSHYTCIDGVRYIVYQRDTATTSDGVAIVPNYKPNGTLHTCEAGG